VIGIILPNDRELFAQLTTRRGWPNSKGRLELEKKQAMRARGIRSPDRADAVLGALAAPANNYFAIIA
jgi:phage terminase large subunit